MLATSKVTRPRSLSHSSKTPDIIAGAIRRDSFPRGRAFSWGAKSGWGSPHAGKVYKGFYTREADAQIRRRKYYLSSGLGRLTPGLGRARASREVRSASSWRTHEASHSSPKSRTPEQERAKTFDDWCNRWETQKTKQLEDFARRIEQDPYQALFGASNRWLGWLDRSVCDTPSAAQARGRPRDKIHDDQIQNHPREALYQQARSSPSIKQDPVHSRAEQIAETKQDDYDIDPITLRKVPKRLIPSKRDSVKPWPAEQGHVGIPVKKFQINHGAGSPGQSPAIPSSQADAAATPSSQDWLAQEGFRAQWHSPSFDSDKRTETQRIESALDRHIKSDIARRIGENQPLKTHIPKENTKDDVDLLRASDIRASAGRKGQPTQVKPVDKQAHLRSLERSHEQRQSELDKRLASEVDQPNMNPETIRSVAQVRPETVSKVHSKPTTHHEDLETNDFAMEHASRLTSSQVGRIRAKLVPLKTKIDVLKEDYVALRKQLLEEKRRVADSAKRSAAKKAREMLDREIDAQQHAMQAFESKHRTAGESHKQSSPVAPSVAHEELHGEGDMASNVHQFANRARWYKRKAPHAQDETEVRLRRLAQEKAFVGELREIYEDAYGTIDTKHHQPALPATEPDQSRSTMSETAVPEWMNLVAQETPSELQATQEGNVEMGAWVSLAKRIWKANSSMISRLKDTHQRASAEPDAFEKSRILSEGRLAASESSAELVSAGMQLLSSAGQLENDRVRRILKEVPNLSIPNLNLNADAGSTLPTPQKAILKTDRSSSTTDEPIATSYRILAYDSSAQRVTSAKTSSQAPFVGENPLTPLQALSTLHNPGKFLSHLTTLHNHGYDIVSGANDVLVLKKVREGIPVKEEHVGRPNPIDGTTAPEVSTGNFASPTGFVNHNPVIPPEEQSRQEPHPNRASGKVRREEDVFSGGNQSKLQEGKRLNKREKRRVKARKTLKRMFLTGLVTAAACYATGVAFEMMRI